MFFRKKQAIFEPEELKKIQEQVCLSESRTSGEIRIFIESHCRWVDPLIRAREIFINLKMHQTRNRNAVLIYIASEDHDFALFADSGLYQCIAPLQWKQLANQLANAFYHQHYCDGLCNCIQAVGSLLTQHFPLHGEQKNELPDEIVFGQ